MKKILFTILCSIAITSTAISQNEIPFYGPVKIYGYIAPVEVTALPSGAPVNSLINYNDTIRIKTASGWVPFISSGPLQFNDTLLFSDGSRIFYAPPGQGDMLSIMPYNVGDKAVNIKYETGYSRAMLSADKFIVNGSDTTNGYAGHIVRKVSDGYIYSYNATIGKWVRMASGGSGSGLVDTLNTAENGYIPIFHNGTTLKSSYSFTKTDSTFYMVSRTGVNPNDNFVSISGNASISSGEFKFLDFTVKDFTTNKVVQWGGQSSNYQSVFYVVADTIKITGSSKFNGTTAFLDTISLNYLNLSAGDTVGLVCVGNNKLDSASIGSSASGGWQVKLQPYWQFYKKADKNKALPLPYPNGTERRRLNALYRDYQIEFELERLHRYLFRLWQKDIIQWVIMSLILTYVAYLQCQINKLRKK
jgi:hypothetical protein